MTTFIKTGTTIFFIMLMSKILGFIRELFFANYFGTSYIADAYVMATSIPEVFFAGIIGAVSVSFIPIYARIVETEEYEKGNQFVNEIINIVLLISVIICIIGIIFSKYILIVFASGFPEETFRLANYFLKITFSIVVLLSVLQIFESYLRYNGKFISQYLISLSQNIVIIFVIYLSAVKSYYLLAFGLTGGYLVRLILIICTALKNGYHYKMTLKFSDNIKKIVLLSVPVFIATGVNSINTFVDRTLASGLEEGSVSALYYASRLHIFIPSLTVIILSTMIYPVLSKYSALEEYISLNSVLNKGIKIAIIIMLPITIGILTYSREITEIVFMRGQFDEKALLMTSIAVSFYSFALVFNGVNELLVKTSYSLNNSRLPFYSSLISVIINIILNLILVRYLQHGGIALATSISHIISAILLYIFLTKKFKQIRINNILKQLLPIGISSLLSIGTGYLLYRLLLYFYMNISLYISLPIVVIISCIIYAIFLHLFKVIEIEEMVTKIVKK